MLDAHASTKDILMSSVCPRCIEEPALAEYITENASESTCDYCHRKWKKPRAMNLSELMPLIRGRIEMLYEDPANSVGYETAEGGYLLATTDSYDVLENVGLGVSDPDLMRDLVDGLPVHEWVHQDPYSLTQDDAMIMSWEEFARIVKHEVRTFSSLRPLNHRTGRASAPPTC